MENVISRAIKVRVLISLALSIICGWSDSVTAQTNSWTDSVSGKWQDAHWSLGQLPGTNQTILFTNAGWKALEIGPDTAQNFPESMSVNSITISSPMDSFNTLLLNYSGLQTPLEVGDTNNVGSLVIGNNCTVVMLSSSLKIHDFSAYYGTFSIGGTFNESDGSQVIGGFVRVGAQTFGVYNLTNSILSAGTEYVGPGMFNQVGGTNFADNMYVGTGGGTGSYTLSDGVLMASGVISMYYYTDIQYFRHGFTAESYGSSFSQSGGFCTNGGIYFNLPFNAAPKSLASYELVGGMLSTPSITIVTGNFSQSGGTNQVDSISLNGAESNYYLDGGWLMAGTVQVNGPYFSGFSQSGGTNQISGSLSISNSQYRISGGQLTAQNMQVSDGGVFDHSGGVVNLPGVLILANGSWHEETGGQQLGPLQLGTGTNSTLSFFTNGCVLQFADSGSLVWSNDAVLTFQNWSGSIYGGGQHQILFGTNASSLTAQQLTQIQFQNPGGLAPGTYPARILATGEIVPDTGAPLPPMANLVCATNGLMHLSIGGDVGRTYSIEVSTDLVHWNTWTNQFNTCGTMTLDDNDSTNCPQRFYRAHAMP